MSYYIMRQGALCPIIFQLNRVVVYMNYGHVYITLA